MNEQGLRVIPTSSRTYIHEIDVHTGGGNQSIDVSVSGGRVAMPGGMSAVQQGVAQWDVTSNGRSLRILTVGHGVTELPAGRTITITVESNQPHRSFSVRQN